MRLTLFTNPFFFLGCGVGFCAARLGVGDGDGDGETSGVGLGLGAAITAAFSVCKVVDLTAQRAIAARMTTATKTATMFRWRFDPSADPKATETLGNDRLTVAINIAAPAPSLF
ncbi:MAG TPA: hypothetical protein VGW32_03600, partial [Pyrinomonadaceae bacterium]|nr:hypothetical protein [Pyrinomonadaceae bacterium]